MYVPIPVLVHPYRLLEIISLFSFIASDMELSDYRILTEAEEKALEEEAPRVIQPTLNHVALKGLESEQQSHTTHHLFSYKTFHSFFEE